MASREIEGSFSLLPPPGFFTRAKAAFAIAIQLHPDNESLCVDAERCYDAKLYDDLCAGHLIGRDPVTRLPILRKDLAGAIALTGAVIAETDLAAWLAELGIGIEILTVSLPTTGGADASPSRAEGSAMEPGPARDEAMLQAHEKYKGAGVHNCLVRVAQDFDRSRSVARDCIRRAKERRKEGAHEKVRPETTTISGGGAWGRQLSALMGNSSGR